MALAGGINGVAASAGSIGVIILTIWRRGVASQWRIARSGSSASVYNSSMW